MTNSNHFACIFRFLEIQNIFINEMDFNDQLFSHPNYPSLVSLSDTLEHFNIKHSVYTYTDYDINSFPKYFMIVTNSNNLYSTYIKVHDKALYIWNGFTEKIIEQEDFDKISKKVFLTINAENYSDRTIQYFNHNRLLNIILFIAFIFSSIIHLIPILSVGNLCLLLCNWMGLYLSLVAIFSKYKSNYKSTFTICNIGSFDCSSMSKPFKFKLFGKTGFSEVSFFFFTFQLLFSLACNSIQSLSQLNLVNKWIFISTIPILLYSLYLQKIEYKKWCLICLIICFIIIIQIFYYLYQNNSNFISFNFFYLTPIYCGLISVIVTFFFITNLVGYNNSIDKYRYYKKLTKNFSYFKLILSKSKEVNSDYPASYIEFGSKKSPIQLIAITSPFCSFCRSLNTSLLNLFIKNNPNIYIQISFNCNIDQSSSTKFYMNLLELYTQEKYIELFESLIEPDATKVGDINLEASKKLVYTNVLFEQYKWNQINKINYTPALFINNREFPIGYDFDDLNYYLQEMVDEL